MTLHESPMTKIHGQESKEFKEIEELHGLMTKAIDRDVRQEVGGGAVWSLSIQISSRS